VACCPANLARLVAQLPGLIYSTDGHQVFVDLYVSSEADLTVNGAKVHIKQTTNYPWDGQVTLEVAADRAVTFPLKVRIPGWIGGSVFGTDLYTFASPSTEGAHVSVLDVGRAVVEPGWSSLEDIHVSDAAAARHLAARSSVLLPMPVRRVVANPGVKDDVGRAAIQRGPVVYALEGVDNDGHVLDTSVPMDAVFTPSARADLLGGVTVLTTTLPATASTPARTITAIPYFAWANRGRGEMVVWVKK
jgi:DUF1680 family protein